jgi:hypothetical protein
LESAFAAFKSFFLILVEFLFSFGRALVILLVGAFVNGINYGLLWGNLAVI